MFFKVLTNKEDNDLIIINKKEKISVLCTDVNHNIFRNIMKLYLIMINKILKNDFSYLNAKLITI